MEHNPKAGNNYSKSFVSDNEFSRGRRPPHRDFGGGGSGGPSRNRNSGVSRDSCAFSGMPSRGVQQSRTYAFCRNQNFSSMTPPGGSFASFTVPDYPSPLLMDVAGDFPMSMGLGGGCKHNVDDKPFNLRAPPMHRDNRNALKQPAKIVTPSSATAVSPVDNTKGGFGRGRRGLPMTSAKLPAGSSSSKSNVFSATVDTEKPNENDAKIANETAVKPSDGADQTHPDVEKSTSTDDTPPIAERFEKTLEIGNYKISITLPAAPFEGAIYKKWSDVGLTSELENRVEELGFAGPRPIQSLVIPMCKKGYDVIFQSVMDGGKLTAIILSILAGLGEHAVGKSPSKDDDLSDGVIRPRSVIVSPSGRAAANAFERCLRVVGDLNFSVGTVASLENGGDCDILCSNLDEMKGAKQRKIVFDRLRIFAIEQAERMEDNFFNLVRFVRTTEGFRKGDRQTIIAGTSVSKKVQELALFMIKADHAVVLMKREAPEKPRRYSKSEMVQVRRTDVAAAAENKSAEQVAEKPKNVYKKTKESVAQKSVNSPKIQKLVQPEADQTATIPKPAEAVQKSVHQAADPKDFDSSPVVDSAVSLVIKADDSPVPIIEPTVVTPSESDATDALVTVDNGKPSPADGGQSTKFSPLELQEFFRSVKQQMKVEGLKTKNELLSAENARLTKRIVVLEQQLGSVYKFFGSFFANTSALGVSGEKATTLRIEDGPSENSGRE